jgi:ATP-dependent Lhr-like helicase
VRQLLDRYGVLTREAVAAEGFGGGFTAAYGVLKAMEDAGRVRRGYFVAGRGATQFALPGAADRLRALREPPEVPEVALVAATDPANPYGAALPWPDRPGEGGRRATRVPGAFVVLVDGAVAAWIGPREHQMITFLDTAGRPVDEVAQVVAACLVEHAAGGRWPTLLIEGVDGRPVDDSPLAPALRAAGFVGTPSGYLWKPKR